jgi:3-deoxy-7-phosphoheptulonate synthase
MPNASAPRVDDLRIRRVRPLLSPSLVVERFPLDAEAAASVCAARAAVGDILEGRDDRLLVVIGPCSIHDAEAALDYAGRLLALEPEVDDALLLVMRTYFEKPRTTVGWKGLINDPAIDGSYRINDGLTLARSLLVDLVSRGVRVGCEFLDTITPQFIADTVCWSAIGARTTESQVHRELASGLSMPVGFKNATNGDVQVAIDAVTAARHPHCFLSVTKDGIAAIVETDGNPLGHVILRGSRTGPNHDAASVTTATEALERAGLAPQVLVDCSHGNSGRVPTRQMDVATSIGERIAAGSKAVLGVMIESNLVEGRQPEAPRPRLAYGQSITDACLGWDDSATTLRALADFVRARRAAAGDPNAGSRGRDRVSGAQR